MSFATIYGLLYGDDNRLHRRFIDSLFKHVPHEGARIRLWCNVVCQQTRDYLQHKLREQEKGIIPSTQVDCHFSADNRPKYKAMKYMFETLWPPESRWIVWFDDDSHIVEQDWWQKTIAFIKDHSQACYLGQPWYVHHLPGQWEFIQQATWYRGLAPELCPARKGRKPGITFAQGAYWWLRTDVLMQLKWPDPRLNHNGGDSLLGEAVRQQGLRLHNFHYGVKINNAKRRGLSEKPAGSTKDVRR